LAAGCLLLKFRADETRPHMGQDSSCAGLQPGFPLAQTSAS
jgi:hypothetical protein